MGPLKYGKLIGEISGTTLLSHKLCILIDLEFSKELLKHLEELCTLRDYLNDLDGNSVRLEVYLSSKLHMYVPGMLKLENAPLAESGKELDSQIIEIADKINADIVVTDSKFTDAEKHTRQDLRFITSSIEDAKLKAEVFVRGHEIPWAFNEPTWNMPWTAFYTMCDHYGREAWSSYSSMMGTTALKESGNEVLRSLLLNKFIYICYARDKLLFYRIQKSYAKRNGFKKQDYKFEAGFYLTFYYLLIWGAIDQLSLVINELLDIGDKGIRVSIAKKEFRKKVSAKNKEIGIILNKDKFLEWFEKLGKFRHFVAHRGNIILSDLMEKPEIEPSQDEIDAEALKNTSLQAIKELGPAQLHDDFLEMLKHQIRVSKYKKISDEAMIFEENGKRIIFFPWRDVDIEFDNIRELISQLLVPIRAIACHDNES